MSDAYAITDSITRLLISNAKYRFKKQSYIKANKGTRVEGKAMHIKNANM